MRRAQTTIWGAFLIVLGGMLMLERMDLVRYPVGTLWPLILFVVAITKIVQRRFGAAVMYVLLGCVFLACTLGWYGMSYARSWPLIMIAAGAGIVVKSLTGESWHTRIERGADHE